MTTLINRLAIAALLMLPMAGGGIALPVMADEEIDFVCYDREIGGGKTEIVCEPADLVAAECEKSDPDGEGAECAAVQDQIRPPFMESVASITTFGWSMWMAWLLGSATTRCPLLLSAAMPFTSARTATPAASGAAASSSMRARSPL